MLRLTVLGSPHLRESGKPDSIRLQPKRLALLAYLAVEAIGRPCRRDTLVALFWPTLGGRQARNALSQALHGLRRAVGEGVLLGAHTEELWIPPDRLWSDVAALEAALGEGRLEEAVELYGGPLLEGLHIRRAPPFEDWLSRRRERLRRRVAEALRVLIERAERGGNLVGAAEGLRRLAELAPGEEPVVRQWMQVLSEAGDRTGALRVYERFAQELATEMELAPSPETQRLAQRLREPAETGTLPSIAVLPFVDLGPDEDNEYFCHGLTEEVIAVLARERDVRVTARTSVFADAVKNREVRSLGNWLGVDAVVEGSVRRSSEVLRVSAKLIDVSTGYHLWSERYDRPWGEALGLQDEIARAVVDALRRRLAPTGLQRPPGGRTHDAEAHDLYLRGLYHRHKRTREALATACGCFERCVARDPEYAHGHAALAYTHALAGWWLFDVFPPRRAYPVARTAAARALAIDDGLPEAHLAVACTRQAFDWDGPAAETAFARAFALDPDDQDILGNYAGHLVLRERFDEAMELTRKAERLDPAWIMPPTAMGLWTLVARRYEEARAQLQRAIDLEPRFFVPLMFMGDCDRFSGRPAEAAVWYDRAIELVGREPMLVGRLASAEAERGDLTAARSLLDELETMATTRFVLPTIVARVHLSMSDLNAAFRSLKQAVEARDTTLAILPVWPEFDAARPDPRYARLFERVALWPEARRSGSGELPTA